MLAVHQFFPTCSLGTERYTLALAHGLQSLGDEVVVLTADESDGPTARNGPLREYHWDGVRVLAVTSAGSPIRRIAEYHTRPERVEIYEELLLRERPDLMHCCHLMHLGIELLEVCRRLDVPATATLTDLWGICWAGQMIKPCDQTLCAGPRGDMANCIQDFLVTKHGRGSFATKVEKALARTGPTALQNALIMATGALPGKVKQRWLPDVSDLSCRNRLIREAFVTFREVIFPSRYLQEECEKHGLIPAGKGQLLPYGIRQPDAAERASLRKPKTKDTTTFAFIGQMAMHKGLHLLLEAFARLGAENVRLVIHGRTNPGDSHAAGLMEMIARTPRAEHAGSFNGAQIFQVLSGVDAVVIPSIWHENAPLTMLEALSAGRPVLVSRARGMVDFVEEGRTGIVFDMNSVDAIELALRRFLKEEVKMREACLNQTGYNRTPEDHARELRGMISGYRRGGEWPERIMRVSLQGVVNVRAIDAVTNGTHPDAIAGNIIRTGIRGCQLRVPDHRGMQTASDGGSRTPPMTVGEDPSAGGLGRTFPRLKPGECIVRTHSKPHVSLWGEGTRMMRLDKLPGIMDSRLLRIHVRVKHGIRSQIKVIGRTNPDGDTQSLVHEWNWSGKTLTIIEIDLAGLRERLAAIHAIEWTPVLSSRRWKLDFFDWTFTGVGEPD